MFTANTCNKQTHNQIKCDELKDKARGTGLKAIAG